MVLVGMMEQDGRLEQGGKMEQGGEDGGNCGKCDDHRG